MAKTHELEVLAEQQLAFSLQRAAEAAASTGKLLLQDVSIRLQVRARQCALVNGRCEVLCLALGRSESCNGPRCNAACTLVTHGCERA